MLLPAVSSPPLGTCLPLFSLLLVLTLAVELATNSPTSWELLSVVRTVRIPVVELLAVNVLPGLWQMHVQFYTEENFNL